MGSRKEHYDIETLRGFAVVLMVMGHVIGDASDTGMRVAEDSGWRTFYESLSPFRMPLFTVISGYVYALRPMTPGHVSVYLKGRLRRLLLPLVCVSTPFLLMHWVLTKDSNQCGTGGLLDCAIYPQAHFWFLYAMTWISIAAIPLELKTLLGTSWRSMLCVAGFGALFLVQYHTSLIGISHAVRLMPYYLFGIGVQRYWDAPLRTRQGRIVLIVLTAALMFVYQLHRLEIQPLPPVLRDLVLVSLGISSVGLAFALRFTVPLLARLGAFSYGIYLLHVFGTAGARIFMYRFDIRHEVAIFIIGTVVGCVFPVLVEVLTDRWAILRLCIFGRTKELSKS